MGYCPDNDLVGDEFVVNDEFITTGDNAADAIRPWPTETGELAQGNNGPRDSSADMSASSRAFGFTI